MKLRRPARGRFVGAAVITLILMLQMFVLPAPSASAVGCPNVEELIFQRSVAGAIGTHNEFGVGNRDLNPNCTAYLPSWSTANLHLGDVYCNWVEVGYWEYWNNNLTQHEFEGFTEWGLGCNTRGSSNFTDNCIINNRGAVKAWQIDNVVGSNSWGLRFDCLDGTGIKLVNQFNGTGFHSGTVTGETGRRGGTATGMSDDQKNLQYRLGNTWRQWPSNYCYQDTATNWDPKPSSTVTNEYTTYKPKVDISC